MTTKNDSTKARSVVCAIIFGGDLSAGLPGIFAMAVYLWGSNREGACALPEGGANVAFTPAARLDQRDASSIRRVQVGQG